MTIRIRTSIEIGLKHAQLIVRFFRTDTMKLYRALFPVLMFFMVTDMSSADEATAPSLSVTTVAAERGFDISGSFVVPLTPCQSYHLLTDYDMERELPGVQSIKHSRVAAHRVRLQRELEERILFVPVQIQSVIEITEHPYRGMDFVQISGNARSYKGQWRLEPVEQGTLFKYKAHTNPGSIFPDSIARQVVEDSLRRNFSAMIEIAFRRQKDLRSQCL